MSDKVHIDGLLLGAIVGVDHWQKLSSHPLEISVAFKTNFASALDSDNLAYSLNYAVVADKIASYASSNSQKNFQSLGGFANALLAMLEFERANSSEIALTVRAPKLDIRSPVSFSTNGIKNTYKFGCLRALTLVGVFTFERLEKQYVEIEVDVGVSSPHLPVSEVSASIVNYVESASFKTVEALVKHTAQSVVQKFPSIETVEVKVIKPNAIVYTKGVGVSGAYERKDFQELSPVNKSLGVASQTSSPIQSSSPRGVIAVYVAFGSNLGASLDNITKAIDLLEQHPKIHVDATSSIYVSKPMYHTDQTDFYNGVVRLLVVDLSPDKLLQYLKEIEYNHFKRIKNFENGPRTIDLDIIMYGDHLVTSPDLVIPHTRMLERTFVMKPLCELVGPNTLHPVTAEPLHAHLEQLLDAGTNAIVQESSDLTSIVPGCKGKELRFRLNGTSPTLLMAIFNTTPDSFSDGGQNFGLSRSSVVEQVWQYVQNGALIIDIGGVSTQPGSLAPLEEEELSRILPVVEAIRSDARLDEVFVSVDTYRANVAEKALKAGADIINDVSMGLFEPEIFNVVARNRCGYIMSHTRGTTLTMSSLTQYESRKENEVEFSLEGSTFLKPPRNPVVHGVCRELADQLDKATEAGVKRWQIILDPGVGFAKTPAQNIALVGHGADIKRFARLKEHRYTSFHGLPTLFGTSRKKFLGLLTEKKVASERLIASVSSVVVCVQQKADIVRVHDVKETKEAIQTADAFYRNRSLQEELDD